MITILAVTQGAGHGAESVLCELLRAWPAGGEPLAVVSPPGSLVLRVAGEAGHRALPLAAPRDAILANWRAAGAAAAGLAGARCVHAWTARGFEGARHLAARLDAPCSGTLHDHPAAAFHGRLRRRIMKRTADGFAGLVCVSDAVRAACEEAGYRCPLTVIRNGLADQTAVRPARGTGVVRVGFLGMYSVSKGFDIVRGWIDALVDEEVEWRLYGEVHPALAGPAAELAARPAGRVRVCGHCPVAGIFAEIDVLAHVSSGFDSLPTVLMEAARAGIPCVACAHGGAGEIVRDGETGFLFPVAAPELGLQRLRELTRDSALRQRQGEAARARFATEFGVARMVRAYEAFWSAGEG